MESVFLNGVSCFRCQDILGGVGFHQRIEQFFVKLDNILEITAKLSMKEMNLADLKMTN